MERCMPSSSVTWTVFTKPWPNLTPTQLADLVARLGFDGIEFPLRPGFQVDLDQIPTSLGNLVNVFADRGLSIASVASDTTPPIMEACAQHAIPMIRIMVAIQPAGFVETGDIIRRRLDSLVPLAEQYGVRIGVQPHYDNYISDSSELANLLRDYDPTSVSAIWDAGHDGLARKHPANALALLWRHIAMVNFKNACYQRRPADGATPPWKISFVEGPEGLCSWPEAAAFLRHKEYSGPICLTAEYSDESGLESKVGRDLAYIKDLVEGSEVSS
jgi:sugar phosphate isomerase/epimerase